MTFNQLLATAAIGIAATGLYLAAYGLRYTPIAIANADGISNPALVWDRWNREVCQVSLMHDYPTACSSSRPYQRRQQP